VFPGFGTSLFVYDHDHLRLECFGEDIVMRRFRQVGRRVSIGAAAICLSGATVVSATSSAAATVPADGTFVACPDVATFATITSPACESLSSAIADAESWNAGASGTRTTATIDLLPGKYCPADITYDPYPITIQGVGFMGMANASDISSYTGFEAQLSEFVWVPSCGGAPGTLLLNTPDLADSAAIPGAITLDNFAVDGTGAGATANGIAISNAPLDARDLYVTNVSGTGLSWQDSYDFYNGSMENSAFVNNGTGSQIAAGFSHGFSIDESTYAGNTTGISSSGSVDLAGDTVSHNNFGIVGGYEQLVQSIATDNGSSDCGNPSQQADFFGSVVGSDCPSGGPNDVDAGSTTIAAVSTSGPAITPSIAPPTIADNIAQSTCGGLDGVDQEESVVTSLTGGHCDAGALQPGGTVSPPGPSPSPQDFGNVPTNYPGSATITVAVGGGIVGISGVDVATTSGTGTFTVTYDNCSFHVMLARQYGGGGCTVNLQATSVDQTETDGTLTFHTSGGDIVDNLTMMGAPAATAPAAPTDLHGTAGDGQVTLTWTPTPGADDGGLPIQYYEVDGSTDAGKTWNSLDNDYDTTDNPVTDELGYQVHNNTTYELRVLAHNGFASSESSNVITLTPEGPATTIASPARATVVDGHGVALTTKLTQTSDHSAVGGATVHLQKRVGTGPFTSAGTATTSSNGTAHITVTPTGDLSYRWVFNGNRYYAPSASATVPVTVEQAVTAKASASSVGHHKPVKVYGTVAPGKNGEAVTLELRSGSSWKKVGSAKLAVQKLPNGKHELGYVITYRPAQSGKEQLRVMCAATSANGAGASPTLRLKVT
jgi:hypothetical protein